MARRQFSAITYNTKYQHNVVGHALNRLQAIYDAMYQEAAKIGTTTGWSDPKKEFFLKDFPKAEAKIDALLKLTAAKVTSLIEDGNDRAWQLSDDKNAEMVQELAKRYKWPEERVQELSRRNLAGVKAFQERVVNGMNLSERVWDFQKNDKQKLEWALELGLAEGKSAQELSRSVRSYLREPNKLFRRVRDKHGNLKLSKAAKAYHPGQGVYRSSYKNALRMTMTENNMAYRTADYDHWNKMDFVIGQEVKLSSVHSISNTLGKKYPNGYRDMCDDLAGVYPKEFKFTGWHPHCRCYVVAKLADYDEMNKWARMTDQERAGYQFQGKVKEMPAAFNAWIDDNAARIEGAGSLPYFIRDNYVDGDISRGLIYMQPDANIAPTIAPAEEPRARTREEILAAAKERQAARTKLQVDDIRDRWALRADELQYPDYMREMFRALEKELGVKRGFSMPYLRADQQSANPKYEEDYMYHINCQTCAPAYVLRRWGFDVTAKGNNNKFGNLSCHLSHGDNWRDTWIGRHGQSRMMSFGEFASSKGYKNMSPGRYMEYFKEVCKEDGIYEIGVSWKGGGGHCTIVERVKGVLRYVEPQLSNAPGTSRFITHDMNYLYTHITPSIYGKDGAIRADNLRFNTKYASIFEPSKQELTLHQQRMQNAAAERHGKRTPEQIAGIKLRWKEHQEWRKGGMIKQQIEKAKTREELNKVMREYRGNHDDVRKLYFDRMAAIRHEARTEAQAAAIKAKFNARSEEYKQIIADAKATYNEGLPNPWIKDESLDLLNEMDYMNKLYELKANTAKVKAELQEIDEAMTKLEEVIPDVKTKWANLFSREELEGVSAAVQKKIADFKEKYATDFYLPTKYATEEEYLKKKLNFEIYDYLGANMNGVQQKHKTWQVSQAAYIKQLNAVELQIQVKAATAQFSVFEEYVAKHPNALVLKNLVAEAEQALQAGDLQTFAQKAAAIEAKNHKLEADQARNKKKKQPATPGAIDFDEIDEKTAQALFDAFDIDRTESADTTLRARTKALWAELTKMGAEGEELKMLLTKYTQTYSYLNEPLRGIRYMGGMSRASFENDMPKITRALGMEKMPAHRVVRRGTEDYTIQSLGKRLSSLNPGDEFVDGAFLSTAVKADGGFHMSYDLRILVPKGAEGVYAEPFTHYNDSCMLDYQGNVWNGKDDKSMGGEREWIAQRGCKFKVIKKSGRTIYLQIIGQRYDQVANPETLFR